MGRELGAGQPERACDASVRMFGIAVASGAVFTVRLLALSELLQRET